MKRKFLFLLILAVIGVGVSSFIIGNSFAKWECPVCQLSGNEISITPMINRQYSETAIDAVNSAESSIDIAVYQMKFYDSNNSVRKLLDAISKAASRGVKVRVILEQGEWQGKVTDLTKENKKTASNLEEMGMEVKFDSIETTTHDKIMIIDSRIVILGSHNWAYSAFEKNNEASVMIKNSEIAAYYENYFENLWAQF